MEEQPILLRATMCLGDLLRLLLRIRVLQQAPRREASQAHSVVSVAIWAKGWVSCGVEAGTRARGL